jgi:hypothetical protein
MEEVTESDSLNIMSIVMRATSRESPDPEKPWVRIEYPFTYGTLHPLYPCYLNQDAPKEKKYDIRTSSQSSLAYISAEAREGPFFQVSPLFGRVPPTLPR